MKAYQDHDPIRDQGKAVPHPVRPTSYGFRGQLRHFHSPQKMGDGTFICKKCKQAIARNEDGNWLIIK